MGAPSPAKRRKKSRQRHHAKQSAPISPHVRHLMDAGWSRRDADDLVLIDFILLLSTERPEAASRLARNAAALLASPPVYAGAQAMYTTPEDAAAWQLLASHSDGDERRRFLTLAAISAGKEVCTVERDQLSELIDPSDLVVLDAARVAEAAGDFAKALELVAGTLRPLDDGWQQDLQSCLDGGDALPAWQWGRMIVSMAVRYVLEPRTVDVATHYASVVLQARGADARTLREQVVTCAVYDQVIHDALLFDDGGLGAFLDFRIAPEVAARCPGIESWPDASLGVWRLTGRAASGHALMQDLVTGRTATVGDTATLDGAPLADEFPVGQLFYGRLVRVTGDDSEYFAMRPTVIDELTGGRVVRAIRDGVIAERRLAVVHCGAGSRGEEAV